MGALGNAWASERRSHVDARDLGLEPEGTSSSQREWLIGEMAKEFSVSLRALRFYEDRGLLKPRRAGGARFYGTRERVRLQMILKGKHLGFTLTEIRNLIGTQEAETLEFEETLRPEQIVGQLDHLERQKREIEAAITKLRSTRERMSQASGVGL